MINLFLFFVIVMLIIIFAFVFFYTGHEYECNLPGGGSLIVRWNEKAGRMEVVRWESGKPKAKKQDIWRVHGQQ